MATATLPKLLYERLDEIGLDFTVLYPSLALVFPEIEDEEVRRAACRGANLYFARYFGEFRDRMAPVASVPMHTPAEAIEELEYAVGEMGFKAVVMPSYVRRPIPSLAPEIPRPRALRTGSIPSAWTASTTTIRYGPNASSSRLLLPFIP